jgi:hypothetical protein
MHTAHDGELKVLAGSLCSGLASAAIQKVSEQRPERNEHVQAISAHIHSASSIHSFIIVIM